MQPSCQTHNCRSFNFPKERKQFFLLSEEFQCKKLHLLCTLGMRYHGRLFPARLYPDFCSNNKVSSTSGGHLPSHLMIRGYRSPMYDRIAEVFCPLYVLLYSAVLKAILSIWIFPDLQEFCPIETLKILFLFFKVKIEVYNFQYQAITRGLPT